MKKHLKTLTSILMCMMLVTSLFPVPGVKAADGPKDNDYVKYYYDSDKPEVRTGYKQIVLAPYIYKDVTNNTKKYVKT